MTIAACPERATIIAPKALSEARAQLAVWHIRPYCDRAGARLRQTRRWPSCRACELHDRRPSTETVEAQDDGMRQTEATVLGLVGSGVIGVNLESSMSSLAWPQVTLILIVILD